MFWLFLALSIKNDNNKNNNKNENRYTQSGMDTSKTCPKDRDMDISSNNILQ